MLKLSYQSVNAKIENAVTLTDKLEIIEEWLSPNLICENQRELLKDFMFEMNMLTKVEIEHQKNIYRICQTTSSDYNENSRA